MKTPDNLKFVAALTTSAAISFIKINLIGRISTFVVIIITGIILVKQCFDSSSPGHAGVFRFVIILFLLRPIAFILLDSIITSSLYLLFTLGNKYVLKKFAYKIINYKGQSLLYPLVDKVLNNIKKDSHIY